MSFELFKNLNANHTRNTHTHTLKPHAEGERRDVGSRVL